MSRKGKRWTKEEDKKLKRLFYSHKSFQEMAEELDRTWYGCKCRLIRLGLVEDRVIECQAEYLLEPNRIPFPPIKNLMEMFEDEEDEDEEIQEDFWFDDNHIQAVISYFKLRLCRLNIQKLNCQCFQKQTEIKSAIEVFETEIQKLYNFSKLSVKEREQLVKKICE